MRAEEREESDSSRELGCVLKYVHVDVRYIHTWWRVWMCG